MHDESPARAGGWFLQSGVLCCRHMNGYKESFLENCFDNLREECHVEENIFKTSGVMSEEKQA